MQIGVEASVKGGIIKASDPGTGPALIGTPTHMAPVVPLSASVN